MRKSRYTNSQILAILKQNENGVPVPKLCRERGTDASTMKRLKELENENNRLKKMYAEERLKPLLPA